MIVEFIGMSVMLVPSSYTDIKRMEVSDRSILLSGLVCIVVNLFILIQTGDAGSLLRMSIGAVFGGAAGFLLFTFGMGFGDVKLMLVMGCWLGVGSFIVATATASVLGSLYGLVYLKLIKKQSIKTELPFVPFLAAGSYAALLFTYLMEVSIQ